MVDQQRLEALGPAEHVLATLTNFTDHMIHNRTGLVVEDGRTKTGVRWEPAIWKKEDGVKVVYKTTKVGKKKTHTRVGEMNGDNLISNGAGVIGRFQRSGILQETAVYLYKQIAEVWKLDNEFAARWASWSFGKEHRDLKVTLAAFMLVQDRCGDPIMDEGKRLYDDDDFRTVGEAMCLIRQKDDINPKLLLRIGDILNLKEIAEINRELGFGLSRRNPARGRYYKVVEKWLRHREHNLPMLQGLVKAGYKGTVKKLARRVGYKPESEKFFEVLGWKQAQASDGRRTMAIGKEMQKENWEDLSEQEICERIIEEKPNYKRICGLVPDMTRAIFAAAVEAGSMSDKDLVMLAPTIEEFGLDKVKSVADRFKAACAAAVDQRARNIARNVKSKEMKDTLEDAADKATEEAFKEVMKDLRVYLIVDKSSSMQGALEQAQEYLVRFLGGFPLERLHVCVFDTYGREVEIKASKAIAVRNAFAGIMAGGATSYAQGVNCLSHHRPAEGEDALILFVGDEEDYNTGALVAAVRRSEINPVAFGMLKVVGNSRCSHGNGTVVVDAAAKLGIPYFPIDSEMFTSDDPYAVTRLLHNLIASTPVGRREGAAPQVHRQTLVEQILKTDLLTKPVWA